MPELRIPNDATIRTLRNFLSVNTPFLNPDQSAILRLHKNWAYMDPMALAVTAAWGGWCLRNGRRVEVVGEPGPYTNYAARMRLFQHLDIEYTIPIKEHEEAGRFMPLRKVSTASDLNAVIGDVSALLHLDREPDGLAAIRYCVSELVRNVLEHSQSPEGAYVCAQRYFDKVPKRVTIAVADCGIGIQGHLGKVYPEALTDGLAALRLAMRPGITGAQKGMYGAPDNAGAGLFITRAIAKATGGYFVLLSGGGAFRLKRCANSAKPQILTDPFEETESDRWRLASEWKGTVAATEIMTDKISNFPGLFEWIRKQLPAQRTVSKRIKFV